METKKKRESDDLENDPPQSSAEIFNELYLQAALFLTSYS